MNYQELCVELFAKRTAMVKTLKAHFNADNLMHIQPWGDILLWTDLLAQHILFHEPDQENQVRIKIDKLVKQIDHAIKHPAVNSADDAWYTDKGGLKDQLLNLKTIVAEFNNEHLSSKDKPCSSFTKCITRFRPSWS